jgi:hypothetical protein
MRRCLGNLIVVEFKMGCDKVVSRLMNRNRLFAVSLFVRHVHLVTECSIEHSEPSR